MEYLMREFYFKSITENVYKKSFFIFFIDLNIFKNEIKNAIMDNKYFLVQNKIEVSYNLNSKKLQFEKKYNEEDQNILQKILRNSNLYINKNGLILNEIVILCGLNNLSKNLDMNEIIFIKKIEINYKNSIFLNDTVLFNYDFKDNHFEIKIVKTNLLLIHIIVEYELLNQLRNIDYNLNYDFSLKKTNNILHEFFKNYNQYSIVKNNIDLLHHYYPYLLKKFDFYQVISLIIISRNRDLQTEEYNFNNSIYKICVSDNYQYDKNNIFEEIFFYD